MISFVYFDLGGVVELDFSGTNKWAEFKKEWGITDEFWDEFEPDLCVGKQKIEPDLLNAFVTQFEKNESIWPVIYEIHNHCKVGLLTNLYPDMFEVIKKHGLIPDISWDVVIDSSVVGLQKPDPKIYQLAEQKAQVQGGEILFVENSPSHIKAAQSLGWQTFLYDPISPIDSSNRLLNFFFSNHG